MDEIKKLKNFWKGKKVLITGHTGFKGSWMCIFLNMLGAKVYGYALKPNKKSLFNKVGIKNFIKKNVYKDIRSFSDLKKIINTTKPEIIFHLASQAIVSESFKDPKKTFETNIMGTVNLLENLKNNRSTKSVVVITTDKVYKINKKTIFKENDELGGIDAYSASKASKEIIVNSYSKSIFFKKKLFGRISTARSGNVIGGGDYSKDRLVPDIFKAINNKITLKIRNPNHIRPWQHVIEPIYGYLLLGQELYYCKREFKNNSWNFGPNSKNFLKVKDLVKITNNFMIEKIKFKIINGKYLETKVLKLNNKKSQKYLNWYPRWDVRTAIKNTLDFEMSRSSSKKVKKICEDQISNYLKNLN